MEKPWEAQYSKWRHGGWYVTNVRYIGGAVGCVSNNYPDKKWRIACDNRDEDFTFPSRNAAALAEYQLAKAQMDAELQNWIRNGEQLSQIINDYEVRILRNFEQDYCIQVLQGGKETKCFGSTGCFEQALAWARDEATQLKKQSSVLNDGYADTIIGDRHEAYDALEVQGVRDINSPDDQGGSCCEVDNENPQFFSVYAHLKEGGVECVGDFATHILANAYATKLATKHRWPIYDCVPSQHR